MTEYRTQSCLLHTPNEDIREGLIMTVMHSPEGAKWELEEELQWTWMKNRLQETEEEITEDDWLELQYSNHILFKAEKDGRQTSESGKF